MKWRWTLIPTNPCVNWGAWIELLFDRECDMWTSCDSARVCACVLQFSLSSLTSLAAFYADGLINGWEMLALHCGCFLSSNALHDANAHTQKKDKEEKEHSTLSVTAIKPAEAFSWRAASRSSVDSELHSSRLMKYTDTQSLLDHRKTPSEFIIPTVSHTKSTTVIVKVFLNVWSASLSDQMQQKSSTMLLQFKPPLHRRHWEGRVCHHHLVAHILITNMARYQDHTKVKVNVITHTVSTVQWCIHAEMDSFNKSRETADESQTWADTSLTDTQFKWIWCW